VVERVTRAELLREIGPWSQVGWVGGGLKGLGSGVHRVVGVVVHSSAMAVLPVWMLSGGLLFRFGGLTV